MLVSAVQQSESATCARMSPPSWASLLARPPFQPLGHHRALSWAPWVVRQLSVAACFTCGRVYVSTNASLSICPILPSLSVSTRPFSTSGSLFLPCKQVPLYHFSMFHMYVLIYSIVKADKKLSWEVCMSYCIIGFLAAVGLQSIPGSEVTIHPRVRGW